MTPLKQITIMVAVGTRPEIIRLSRIIKKLNEAEAVNLVLVNTGQNYDYELNKIFFDELDIPDPDYFLNAAGQTAMETIGNIFIKFDPILESIKPDALLVLGDTNSCLCAIPAKRRKIPIFHMEAGNRCYDLRVPEETNRKIIDHISDVNLAYSEIAKQNLLREGLAPDRVFKTGSPMREVINSVLPAVEKSSVLEKLKLKMGKFFVVSAHREENIESDNFSKLIKLLNSIAERYNLPVIVSTHPRTRNKLEQKNIPTNEKIRFLKPLGFADYIRLQTDAKATLSDSGTISEESSILNFPALNIRETHERQEAAEEGSVMMTGMNPERVLQGLSLLESQQRGKRRDLQIVSDYEADNVSEKVIRLMISYIDYVNRTVWSK